LDVFIVQLEAADSDSFIDVSKVTCRSIPFILLERAMIASLGVAQLTPTSETPGMGSTVIAAFEAVATGVHALASAFNGIPIDQ
jgi:hypothetical protein